MGCSVAGINNRGAPWVQGRAERKGKQESEPGHEAAPAFSLWNLECGKSSPVLP